MRKIRGFLLKTRVTTLFRCFLRRNKSPVGYRRLNPLSTSKLKPISRLLRWGQRLKTKASAICCKDPGPGYVPMGQDLIREKDSAVPKGHMAVYVGQKDGEFRRVVVPVMYFNHPLFGQLLREAEDEYGFNQPGGINIPCRISEFESVKTRIAAGHGGRKMLTWM